MAVPSAIKVKDEYKAIQSAEEESLLPKASNNDAPETTQNKKKKRKRKRKKRKAVSCWSLIFKMNFLFFAVNCLTPIALFGWWYMMRPNTQIPYIISGILGLIISITGYRTFTQLISLTAQANIFEKNNQKMRGEHREIRSSVNNIKRANKQLRVTEHRLRAANKKNQQNLNNFRDVQAVMKQLNVDDFKEVTNKAATLGKNWHTELLQQERNMLHLIFDRYEMGHGGQEAMTKDEFEKFAGCLPEQYQKRFARLGTFEKLSNNKGRLEYADFEMVLDVFAEMVVDDVDIELELVKTPNVDGNNMALDLLDPNPANNISEQDSYMSDYGSDSEEDNTNGNGFGFLNKLNAWRKGRKQDRVRKSANLSRRLIFKSKTPTSNKSTYGFEMYDNLQNDNGSPLLSPTYNASNSGNNLQTPVLDKNNKNVPVILKSTSAIEASHNIDEMSLNDDEINAYMQQNK